MSMERHRPIRLGQVGGGAGAFIGDVHRMASRLDGAFTLVAGALVEAKALAEAVKAGDAAFILTHNYSGYPLVREAKALIGAGVLGTIRVVQVEYPQDWMTDAVETQGSKQAEWRADPQMAGLGGATGDIGTHAYHLVRFVTGLALERLSADLSAFVPGRVLDDNAHVLLRFQGGARGKLWCSQVARGHENGLKLRVFGNEGGLAWFQEDPNVLWLTRHGEPARRLSRGGPGTSGAHTRIPAGHPEGFIEGFANLYADAARLIRARQAGRGVSEGVDLPDIRDGVEGVAFVEACVRSSRADAAWVELDL